MVRTSFSEGQTLPTATAKKADVKDRHDKTHDGRAISSVTRGQNRNPPERPQGTPPSANAAHQSESVNKSSSRILRRNLAKHTDLSNQIAAIDKQLADDSKKRTPKALKTLENLRRKLIVDRTELEISESLVEEAEAKRNAYRSNQERVKKFHEKRTLEKQLDHLSNEIKAAQADKAPKKEIAFLKNSFSEVQEKISQIGVVHRRPRFFHGYNGKAKWSIEKDEAKARFEREKQLFGAAPSKTKTAFAVESFKHQIARTNRSAKKLYNKYVDDSVDDQVAEEKGELKVVPYLDEIERVTNLLNIELAKEKPDEKWVSSYRKQRSDLNRKMRAEEKNANKLEFEGLVSISNLAISGTKKILDDANSIKQNRVAAKERFKAMLESNHESRRKQRKDAQRFSRKTRFIEEQGKDEKVKKQPKSVFDEDYDEADEDEKVEFEASSEDEISYIVDEMDAKRRKPMTSVYDRLRKILDFTDKYAMSENVKQKYDFSVNLALMISVAIKTDCDPICMGLTAERVIHSIYPDFRFSTLGALGTALIMTFLKEVVLAVPKPIKIEYQAKEFKGINLKLGIWDNVMNVTDDTEKILDSMDDLTNTPLFGAFKDCILGLVMLHLFDKETAKVLWCILGKPRDNTSYVHMVKSCLKTMLSLIRVADAIRSGTSIYNALFPTSIAMRGLEEVKICLIEETRINFSNVTEKPDIVDTSISREGIVLDVDARDWLRKMGENLKLCRDIVSRDGMKRKLKFDSYTKFQVMSTISLGSDCYDRVLHQLMSMSRIPPVFLGIVGEPGVGKSTFMEICNSVMSRAYGLKTYDKAIVFHRNMASEYHDGLQSHRHFIYHFSELGQLKSDVAKTNIDPCVKEILSLVDSQQVFANMAELSEKGRVPLYPLGIVADSNNKTLGFDDTHKFLGAIFRRLWRVTINLKSEYINASGTVREDIPRAEQMNIWKIKFERFRNTSEIKVAQSEMFTDIQEFSRFLYLQVRKHLARNGDVSASFSATNLDNNVTTWLEDILDAESTGLDEEKDVPDDFPLLDDDLLVSPYDEDTPIPIMAQADDGPTNLEGRVVKALDAVRDVSVGLVKMSVCKLLMGSEKMNTPNYAVFLFIMSLIFFWWSRGIVLTIISLWCVFFSAMSLSGEYVANSVISHRFRDNKNRFFRGIEYLLNVKSNAPHDYRLRTYHVAILSVLSALTVVSTAGAIYYGFQKKKKKDPEVQPLAGPIEPQVKMMPVEDLFPEADNNERRKVSTLTQWINIPKPPMNVFTENAEVLDRHLSNNVRQALVLRQEPDGKRQMRTHILGIRGGTILMNKHTLKPSISDYEIRIANSQGDVEDTYVSTFFNESDVVSFGVDMCLLVVSGMNFKDITGKFSKDYLPSSGKARIDHTPTTLTLSNDHFSLGDGDTSKMVSHLYTYHYPGNAKGKCGLPLMVELTTGASIVGVHIGGYEDMGFAQPITFKELHGAMSEIARKEPTLMPIIEQTAVDSLVSPNNPRHVMFHEKMGNITVLGQLQGPGNLQKRSGVVPSPLNEGIRKNSIRRILEKYNLLCDKEFGPPIIKPQKLGEDYVPYNRIWRRMAATKCGVNRGILRLVVEKISQVFSKVLMVNSRKIGRVDLVEACNGVPIDDFFRRINASTSAGFGLKGLKREYFIEQEDGLLIPNDVLLELVEKRIRDILDGENFPFVYKGSLKDEITSSSKISSGKTRMFYAMSLVDLLVSRMFLGNFFTSFVELGSVIGSCVGTNAHTDGNDWFSDFEFSSLMSDWDHKDYDLDNLPDISWGMSSIIFRVMQLCGVSDNELKVVVSLLSNNLLPTVVFNNVVIQVPGLIPSGDFATAEKNCLRGIVMNLYAYVVLSGERGVDLHVAADEYFRNVRPRFYGDDSRVHVKESAKWFNANVIADFYRNHYGMTITSATKSDTLADFTSLEDMVFLKRNMRFRSDLNRWVLPLEVSSIVKSLEWILPSKAITLSDQVVACYKSALRELFFHLEYSKFVELRRDLDELVVFSLQMDVRSLRFYTKDIDTMWDDFCLNLKSEPPSVLENGDTPGEVNITANSERRLEDLIVQWSEELKELDDILDGLGVDPTEVDVLYLRSEDKYRTDQEYRIRSEKTIGLVNRWEELHSSIAHAKRQCKKLNQIVFQSEDRAVSSSGPASEGHMDRMENFTDTSGTDMKVASIVETNTDVAGFAHNRVNLDDFFSRPVQIGTQTWTSGTDINGTISLWDTYLNDPTVRAKLRNVSMIRADMVVDVSCSGNQFMYGAMAIAPVPFPLEVAPLNTLLAALLSSGNNQIQVAKYLMSLPGAQVLDPNANTVLRFVIPFISPLNGIRLYNSATTALGAGSNFTDAQRMLDLRYSTINQLSTTASTSSNASINFYAHLINVKLGPPSGTVITITTQADDEKVKEKDERAVGPIEWVSTRIAHVSGLLSSIPEIAPFALASEMLFGTAAKIAAIWGFSYPSSTLPNSRMKNFGYSNAANFVGVDTSYRLTMDPKQELTIYPGIVGDSQDYMMVKNLASKWSLLTTFNWSTATAPQTNIYEIAVHPRAKVGAVSGLTTCIQPTWVDFVASTAAMWRGEMEYMIQFVVSPQHKGKFGVSVEPNIAQAALIASGLSLNKHYTHIIDLQETTVLHLKVGWQFPREWATNVSDSVALSMCGTLGASTLSMYEAANGYLSFFPFTQLQSPNGAGCYVNVYVRCPDLMITHPTEAYLPTNRVLYQSEDEPVPRKKLSFQERAKLHGWTPEDYNFPVSNDMRSLPQIVSEISVYCLWFGTQYPKGPYTRSQYIDLLLQQREKYRSLKQGMVKIEPQSDDQFCCEQPTKIFLNPTGYDNTACCENTYGEHIVSFRGYLHRYGNMVVLPIPLNSYTGPKYIYSVFRVYPVGQVMGSTNTDKSLLSYLRLAYLGMHGGIKKRLSMPGITTFSMDNVNVLLDVAKTSTPTPSVSVTNNSAVRQQLEGSVTFLPHSSGGIEVEIPYYSNNAFMFACNNDGFTPAGTATYLQPLALRSYVFSLNTAGPNPDSYATEDTAVADDFSLLRPLAPAPYGYP